VTTYTFVANSSTQLVDWSNPAIWSGDAVPNGPSADVVIPEVDYAASGSPFVSFITVSSDYAAASLAITENFLEISNGTLSISGALDVQKGGEIDMGGANPIGSSAGTLDVGSCDNVGDIQGWGALACSGLLDNLSAIGGDGLTVSAGSLENSGELGAENGNLTLSVARGGFANLTGSTLMGGAYYAGSGDNTPATFYMNVGVVVTTDAANITLGTDGDIQFYDSSQSAYVPIEASLQTVAASGTLRLEADAPAFGALAVDGDLLLEAAQPTFSKLAIDPQGALIGYGVVNGSIVDNGVVRVGYTPDEQSSANGLYGGSLEITGPVSGNGSLEIGAAGQDTDGGFEGTPGYSHWTLQLDAATSTNVEFLDGNGILILEDPTGFTGAIAPTWSQYGSGDEIQLAGIALSSVTSYSYSGDANGGVLKLDLGGSTYELHLTGDFVTADFSLSAGPQTLTTDPPSLDITLSGPAVAAPDLVKDDFDGAGVSDLLISNTSGQVVVGQVGAGGQEAWTQVSGLGPEWTFRGAGDFLGDGRDQYLIENSNGAVVVGEVLYGAVTYTQIGGLGPEWTFAASGAFQGGIQDEFLIENTSGALVLGDVHNGQASYVQVGALGPEWKFVGSGDYLGDGRAEFLIENASGDLVLGRIQDPLYLEPATAKYTQIAVLGSEWKFVGNGDVLGDGKDQFLMENAAGAVVAGEIGSGGQVQYTTIAGLGPEWRFVGAGDYLGEGHDQFAIENTNGALVLGDYVGGQVRYTQVGALGSEWSFHD
jgi:hypothetical protein